MRKDYETPSQAMEALEKEGYTEDLNLKSDRVVCSSLGLIDDGR